MWSQFCYVGALVAVAGYFINFCKEAGRTSSNASDLLAVGRIHYLGICLRKSLFCLYLSSQNSPLTSYFWSTAAVAVTQNGADFLQVAQGLYAFNRFLAGGLMMIPAVKPRYMLATYLGMYFIFSIAAMNTSGTTSIALLILVFCFESCCFATIFTLGLRGLGRHTKRGGSFLVAGISGGMVFPPMMGAGEL